MNWDALGAIGELVGAVAVIGSLIYVAVQIRANTAESKTARTQNLVSSNSEITAHIANNPELTETIRKGMINFESLSPTEQTQFSLIFYSIYNQWDFAYHQYLSGLLDKTFFDKLDHEIPLYTTLPGTAQWWENDKDRMSKEFREYVDKRMANHKGSSGRLPTLGEVG